MASSRPLLSGYDRHVCLFSISSTRLNFLPLIFVRNLKGPSTFQLNAVALLDELSIFREVRLANCLSGGASHL